MRAGLAQPSVAANRQPSRAQPLPYIAIDDQIRPVNLVLPIALLGCLAFWCAVAFGIVAVF